MSNTILTYKGVDKESFYKRLNIVSAYLGIKPVWLEAMFTMESGMNPKAHNSIGAAGLQQIIPSTARGLGVTTDQILRMNGTQQLDLLQKYFEPYKGRIKSFYDLYLINFYPAALGQDDNWQFPSVVVQYNKPFDINNDGKLTLGEWKAFLRKKFNNDSRLFNGANKEFTNQASDIVGKSFTAASDKETANSELGDNILNLMKSLM
jgi:hypothetical protein